MDFGFTGLAYLDATWVMNRTINPSQAIMDEVKSFFTAARIAKTLDYDFPDQFHKTVHDDKCNYNAIPNPNLRKSLID